MMLRESEEAKMEIKPNYEANLTHVDVYVERTHSGQWDWLCLEPRYARARSGQATTRSVAIAEAMDAARWLDDWAEMDLREAEEA